MRAHCLCCTLGIMTFNGHQNGRMFRAILSAPRGRDGLALQFDPLRPTANGQQDIVQRCQKIVAGAFKDTLVKFAVPAFKEIILQRGDGHLMRMSDGFNVGFARVAGGYGGGLWFYDHADFHHVQRAGTRDGGHDRKKVSFGLGEGLVQGDRIKRITRGGSYGASTAGGATVIDGMGAP
jgi:hypothetical protein